MPNRQRSPLEGIAVVLLSLTLLDPGGASASAGVPTDDEAIAHALNRLAYGPRPGDIEKVRALGLPEWTLQQLHPERIDDRALAPRVAGLETLALSTHDLLKGYEIPREARREIQKKRAELGDEASDEDRRRARRELTEKYASRMEGSPRQVLDELQEAKVLRAVYAERQLDEVLVDFWLNHFNVYAQKGPLRFLIAEYEREVIRPRAWGRFENLLLATAHSPAMLFYLDNWLSADPDADRRGGERGQRLRRRRFGFGSPAGGEMGRRGPEGQGRQRRRGLNENYAREIMELHTLGVDGGYTQKDVTEVARCFTGWTIHGLREQRPEFAFDARIHDRGDKVVLGQLIEGSGEGEGRAVIHMLATHPSTARFLATKLARRFVSDDPPASLVDRAAEAFRRTDGDIRAVVETIVTSPELFAPEARSAKVKTPLEFVVSAVRASGARVDDASDLARSIADMGMPLYMQQPPTGYKDTADAWVSTSGMLARLNFALDLAGGRVRGVSVEPGRLTAKGEGVAGLALGSPEFQRR